MRSAVPLHSGDDRVEIRLAVVPLHYPAACLLLAAAPCTPSSAFIPLPLQNKKSKSRDAVSGGRQYSDAGLKCVIAYICSGLSAKLYQFYIYPTVYFCY